MPPTQPLASRQALEARVMLISSWLYLDPGTVGLADWEEGWRLGGSPSVSRPQYCQLRMAEPQGRGGERKINSQCLAASQNAPLFLPSLPKAEVTSPALR